MDLHVFGFCHIHEHCNEGEKHPSMLLEIDIFDRVEGFPGVRKSVGDSM